MAKQHLTVDAETIARLLEEGGWTCSQIDAGVWRGRFRGSDDVFPYIIRVDEERRLLSFAIVPFLHSPQDERVAAALYTRLLQLNQVLLMAKFSIDDDLDVVLSVDYPTSHLDESEFRDCLDALFYYADAHHDELTRLQPGSDA